MILLPALPLSASPADRIGGQCANRPSDRALIHREGGARPNAGPCEDATPAMLLKNAVHEQADVFRPPLDSSATLNEDERRARILALMPGVQLLFEHDYPAPEPYNSLYPHPLSSYASPATNQAAVKEAGYDKMLAYLLATDPAKVKGDIIASAKPDSLLPPALGMLSGDCDGNAIPDHVSVKFNSYGGARLQVGSGVTSPFVPPKAPAVHHFNKPSALQLTLAPPRFKHSSQSPPDSARPSLSGLSSADEEDIDAPLSPWSSTTTVNVGSASASPWHKTELCFSFSQKGTCRYGASCQVSVVLRFYLSC